MIRANHHPSSLTPCDLEDTIIYFQGQIKKWEVFKTQTVYFQTIAVDNIKTLEEKIKVLKSLLDDNATDNLCLDKRRA